jgi:hypothetical protein
MAKTKSVYPSHIEKRAVKYNPLHSNEFHARECPEQEGLIYHINGIPFKRATAEIELPIALRTKG